MDTTRPTWMPAQVTVEASKDFHIVLEGQATNGGFAVDDITFTPGSCPSKCLVRQTFYTYVPNLPNLPLSLFFPLFFVLARPEKAAIKNQAKAA